MAHAATSDRRSHLVMRRALSGLAPWIERLARLGFLARGLVYVLIGVLAIRVAFGLGRRYADAGGVLRVLLAEPFGRVLLVVVAAGLLGFAAWQAAAAIFDLERQGARFSGWLARVGYAVSAFVHLALGVDALRLVVATRPGRSIDPVHYWTVRALSAPHGTWLVAMVGAGVTVAGLDQLRQAWIADVVSGLALDRAGRSMARWAVGLGRVGVAARAVVLLVIGGFLIHAAQKGDAHPVGGLARALRALDRSYGPWLLAAVALGFAAYGLFQIFSARYRVIRAG
ncbi:MAG: hypothetical protein DMF81_11745 [Acidobacteria bacterium]|nr:MAG: hypothetical protein DMF81_11745 [Acidobacteriota bacterium]